MYEGGMVCLRHWSETKSIQFEHMYKGMLLFILYQMCVKNVRV